MYARVPEHLKDPLLKELRQLRLRSAIKYFPALVLVFSTIAALVIFVKGHAIIAMLRDAIPLNVPDTAFMIATLGVIVAVTAAVLVFFLRQMYRECECQECLFCPKCEAVDKYDTGACPICQAPLTERASFYFTTYKDEEKVVERWGLQRSREP